MQATTPQGFGPHWMSRQRLGEPGEVFTFYSYKGGTGRSMGLVNCAGLIAQQLPSGAKPLLLLDFDLEAPGLHRYLTPCLDRYASEQQQGVLELFDALSKQVDALLERRDLQALDDESAAALVMDFDLSPYKLPVRLPGATPQSPVALELIVAGRFDHDYDARLQRFDWPGLFARAPALFRAFSARLAGEHSFVFVDSRTGLSDTSGISTMLLPDVLVVVFTPNSQSLTGIEHLVRKAVDYRANAPDLRPLRVYPLASRVDNQVEHFRQVWRMGDPVHPLFGAVMGYQPLFASVFSATLAREVSDVVPRLSEYFDQVQVPHAADYAFGERLCFVQQSSSDSLSIRGAYELFLPWIVTGAQPWERPGDRLHDLHAALWLRDTGVADGPATEADWPAWFDRAARVRATSETADLPLLLLTPDRRFDVALAQSLALAHVGDFGPARASLDTAAAAYGEESAPSIAPRAPAALLKLLQGDPPPPEAQADAAAWLEGLDKLLGRWQPLPRERRAWLEALLPLATEWGLPELRVHAAVQLDGEGSEPALKAQLAAAQARERAGDMVGALALVETMVAAMNPLAGGLARVVRDMLPRLRAQVRGSQMRALPAISDCDSSAWVSFSRADDAAWLNWITQFKGELERGLRARLRGVRLPPLSSAEGEGPVTGDLSTSLARQLGRSFSFILVVGDHAAESRWCQRETEVFIEMYGPAALQRLYILALTRRATQHVLAWPLWQKHAVDSMPAVTEFFSSSDPDKPTPIFMAPGLIGAEFAAPFTRLREDLAMSIRASLAAQSEVLAESPAPDASASLATPTSLPAPATLYVESNHRERSLWQPIGRTLRERWDRLQPQGSSPPPALRVRGLPLDDPQGFALLGDADGVLLLWGKKSPKALIDQIGKVEAGLPQSGEPCPGAVAHLSPPQPAANEPVPAWGWPVLRFLLADAAVPAVHAGDAAELDQFLRDVMSHAAARRPSV